MNSTVQSFAKVFSEEAISQEKPVRLASLSMLLVDLKAKNRDLYERLKKMKRGVQQEKAVFDEKSVSLHSSIYERKHLEKEIAACQAYESGYDKLDLVPPEEYLAGAMVDAQSDHEQMLGRLEDECFKRKALMEEVKLAEIKREAEKDQLSKLYKELESLRDHAKTIYKMASSYKLVQFAAKAEPKKVGLARLYDELVSFAGEKEGWSLELLLEAKSADEDEDEEGAIDVDSEADDEAKSEKNRHDQVSEVRRSRKFAFTHIEVLPPLEVFNGTLYFYHSIPTDPTAPMLLSLQAGGTEDVGVQLLGSLQLDATMKLTAPIPESGLQDGVSFKWLQVATGLETDIAFSDCQRCLSAFFEALRLAEHVSEPAAEMVPEFTAEQDCSDKNLEKIQ